MSNSREDAFRGMLPTRGEMIREEFMPAPIKTRGRGLWRPTRRETLKFGTAAMLSTLAGPAAFAATPSRGGHVRIGVRGGATSDSLDPQTFSDVFIRTMAYGYLNTLVGISAADELAPELAESWEASDDATEWVFRLRDGVTFHNGKSFDADDAIASIRHHMGEDSKSGMKSQLAGITDMRKDGSHTLVFTLIAGNADFPFVLADYRMMMMPSVDGVADWRSGIGTGGYRLTSFDPGVEATLERYPDYWRSEVTKFDSAHVLRIPDVSARQNALMSGDVDVIDQVDLATIDLLKRRDDVSVLETKGALHYVYSMNTQSDPFTSNDIRMALKYGVDREALLNTILRGYGSIGNDHPIAPTHQFLATDIEQTAYDPDKARHHLRKAGLETLDVDLSVSDFLYAGAVDGAVLFSENAKSAGINLTVNREPSDGYFSNVWMKKPFVASYWGARPTEDLILTAAYAADSNWNETRFQHERFNELLAAARAELDTERRREMYRDIQIILRDEGGTIVPLFASNVFAVSSKISTPDQMSGIWELDGGRLLERWSFA